jgi:hypothetical protein
MTYEQKILKSEMIDAILFEDVIVGKSWTDEQGHQASPPSERAEAAEPSEL